MGSSELVLKMGLVTMTFNVILAILTQNFNLTYLRDNLNGFELQSLNLQQICISGFSRLVLKMGVIDLDLQGLLIQNSKELRSTSLLI